MIDLLREAPLGQAIRWITNNRLLQYPEEKPDFELPLQYTSVLNASENLKEMVITPLESHLAVSGLLGNKHTLDTETLPGVEEDLERLGMVRSQSTFRTAPYSNERFQAEQQLDVGRTRSIPIIPQKTTDGVILVDWYTTDDPANPQNWSSLKKGFIVFIISLYTWVAYVGSSLFAPSEGGVEEHFGVGPITAELGLSLFVLAYGVGPLLFGPLSEIPIIGRNPIYYLTFFMYWVLSFPTAVVDHFGGLLALRFFQGFFGSPAVANGGATFGDIFSLIYVPYGLCWWVFAAWGGPALGPLIGGFAVMGKGWRWPLWEIVWMSSPMLLLLLCWMPETLTSNILLRRAKRLRKLTGNLRLQAQSEIDQRNLTASGILASALIKPVEIMLKDPAILFVNIYTAFFYGTYYTFFEVFPLVFPPFYGFNLGETGVAFLSCQIGALIGILGYFAYLHWYMIPDNIKHGLREQEHRLVPAIVGSFFLPVGLFIFAWTANSKIHWIVPLIGVVIFVTGMFWILQALFVYIPFSYPKYAASLFAGNDISRAATAAGCIQFARPLFINLGIHKGVSVLAGLSVIGIPGTIAMYAYGKQLRSRSKFAQS
jgi:DHA1 family multidrug resistance protein-like MFS transporter